MDISMIFHEISTAIKREEYYSPIIHRTFYGNAKIKMWKKDNIKFICDAYHMRIITPKLDVAGMYIDKKGSLKVKYRVGKEETLIELFEQLQKAE